MRLKIATMAVLLAGLQWFAGYNASAGTSEDRGPQEIPSQNIPWPTKSWLVSTPEEQGMESGSLARLIDNVGSYKQDSSSGTARSWPKPIMPRISPTSATI